VTGLWAVLPGGTERAENSPGPQRKPRAPFYRIVVSDSTSTPSSRNVDTIGTYDPASNPATIRLDVPRADEWIRKGRTRPRP